MISQPVKRKNLYHWELEYLVQLVGSTSHLLCTDSNPGCFGETCLLENQQDMIQQVSRDDNSSTFHDSLI